MSIYFTVDELEKLDAELTALLEWEAKEDGVWSDSDIDYFIVVRVIRSKIRKEQIRRSRKVLMLTIADCIKQFELYVGANKDLGNSERAKGFQLAADFLRENTDGVTTEISGVVLIHKLAISAPVSCGDEAGLDDFLQADPDERRRILTDAYVEKVYRQVRELDRVNGTN